MDSEALVVVLEASVVEVAVAVGPAGDFEER